MLARLERLLSHARVRRGADVLLAAVLAAASLVEVLAVRDSASSWGGRGATQILLAVAATVPLAWRVRFPIAVAVVISAAAGWLVVLAAPHQAPFEPFVAIVLAVYSIGAHSSRRRAAVGFLLVFAAGLPFSIVASRKGETGGNLLPTLVWLLGAVAVGGIIRSWRERARRLEALTELQAEAAVAVERGRIARELHDVIAHNVSMIVVQAAAAARVLRADEPDVRDALRAIETTGRETVDEMRRMLGIVRAPDDGVALAPQPTLRDVARLVTNVRDAGLPVELHVEGDPIALPPGIDLSAYRIVQEALTNALKHAGGASASAIVTVRYRDDAVQIEVVDDGDGSGAGDGTGHGLIGMRERVALWGGELEARRREGGGFVVRATLPAT